MMQTATTAASSGTDTALSVSGTIQLAPNQPTNHVHKDDLMQQIALAPNTVASIGRMSPMDNSGTRILNPETISTPPQP